VSIQIGKFTLNSQVLLAPMAGTSDKPFRLLCKAQGAALTPSEMVVLQAHLLNSNKSKSRLDFSKECAPISVQIAGSMPQELAQSAQKAVELGADIVDINMGCPAKKVCNKAAGSALMQNTILVQEILQSVVGAVSVPVTLKMRTGWDNTNKNAPEIAHIAQMAGIQMLSIHGRTRADKYHGKAEYDTIKTVGANSDIPVIANGDITSAYKAREVLDYTGAAGVMIGRAAQGNPWIIGEIDTFLKTGVLKKPIAQAQKHHTALLHITQIHTFYGEQMGVRIARKHILWYLQHFTNTTPAIWQTLNSTNNAKQQCLLMRKFLQKLV
jgi:tRNA-dihydrouridine synthase B